MTKKERFMLAMLENPTVTKAFQSAGISRTMAYKYLKDEDFKQELERRRNEAVSDAVNYLQSNLTRCAEVLIDIVNNQRVPPQVRINAVNSVFTNAKAMTESVDFLLRVVELEKRTKVNGIGGEKE